MAVESKAVNERDGLHWIAAPDHDLLWFRCDGQVVLHHLPSGKTHFLNEQTARLLGSILRFPTTANEAARRLLPPEADSEDVVGATTDYLDELLPKLDELGLVRRA